MEEELISLSAPLLCNHLYLFHIQFYRLTCLYLALKSTNHPLSLSQYSHKVAGKDQTPESVKEIQQAILGLEFSVSQALNFQYWVLDPTKGVGGLLMGLRVSSAAKVFISRSKKHLILLYEDSLLLTMTTSTLI